MFTIYVITNQLNKKKYVGKTSRDVDQRFREHINESRTASRRVLSRAIRKHGSGNFSIEPIRQTDDENEANWFESLYIGITRSHGAQFGYNCTHGGEGVRGTAETRARIGLGNKGKIRTEGCLTKLKAARKGRTPALGMIHTAEWKKQHSADMSGSNHFNYGKSLSVETREKISAGHLRRPVERADEIVALYTQGWRSRKISKALEIKRSTVRYRIARLQRTGTII